jgi:antirestriction protein ArdC
VKYLLKPGFWLKVLKDDKRAIFTAASHAQKAADYLHGLQPQTGTEVEERQEEEALA